MAHVIKWLALKCDCFQKVCETTHPFRSDNGLGTYNN